MNPISERLLEGDTVFTVMSPDTTVDRTAPDHLEGFEMTPCVVRSTHIWGATDTILVGPDARESAGGVPVHFYYANMRAFYTTGAYTRSSFDLAHRDDRRFSINSLQRYKLHEFQAVPDYGLVWDSAGTASTPELAAALARGRRLKIALEVEEEIWIVNRIGHALVQDDDSIVLMAVACPVPHILFVDQAHYDDVPDVGPTKGILIASQLLQAGLSVSTEGWMIGRIERGGKHAYRRLRIFEQNE